MHFTAFHPDYKMLDQPPTPPATLERARRIALGNGIHYAYVGNVYGPSGASTVCHQCGEKVVGRNGYTLTHWGLDATGACGQCGVKIAGVFEPTPGSWGARRQPIRLNGGPDP
jgi:pyruvate formate lyase activating enzyme